MASNDDAALVFLDRIHALEAQIAAARDAQARAERREAIADQTLDEAEAAFNKLDADAASMREALQHEKHFRLIGQDETETYDFEPTCAKCRALASTAGSALLAELHEEKTVASGLAEALVMAVGGDPDDGISIPEVMAEARAHAKKAIAALGNQPAKRWRQCRAMPGIEHVCTGDATHAQFDGAPFVCAAFVAAHQKLHPTVADAWAFKGRLEENDV